MRKYGQRGVTLVETAVVILLFFSLVFATLEFGRAYNMYHAITNAARAGARYAIAPCSFTANNGFCGSAKAGAPMDKNAVEGVVKQWLTSANIDPTGPSVVVSVQQGESVNLNNVQLSYTHVHVEAPYSFFFLPFSSVTLKTDAVMRNEIN
jgi:Flp pilus assembly protein TadG